MTEQKPTPDMGSAVMEAFRALRADNVVQTATPGTQRRRARVDTILGKVAPVYGVTPKALGAELARMLTQ